MSKEVDLSRNIILVNDRIPYVRRKDLEDPFIATIWIEIKTHSKTNLLIMGGYCQWKLIKNLNILNSHKNEQQLVRFNTILSQ